MSDIRKGKRIKSERRTKRRHTADIDELFAQFKQIKSSEGISENTLKQYDNNFTYFKDYLKLKGLSADIREINEDVLRNYIIYMREEIVRFENHKYKTDEERTIGLAPSTINTRLKTLRVMFGALYAENIIDENPMASIKNIREPIENITVLTVDELKRLFSVVDKRNYADFRDYVLMNFLLDCMTRISEAINLQKSNFNLTEGAVVIPAKIAKNRKFRIIPMSPTTVKLISELISENDYDFDTDYVFLTNYGEKITRDHFRKRLNVIADRAGIKKNVHPHLFRHTAATMFLENGGDMRHLQILLGHSDLRMVTRYTHLSDKAIANQHAKYTGINQVITKLNKPRKTRRK